MRQRKRSTGSSGITRRDFLDGMALAIVAGLAPRDLLARGNAHYPPALTGLRGQHDGSFDFAHRLASGEWAGPTGDRPVEDEFDCIVVGAGISGLAAAWFERRRVGAHARILVLDNHDDFGGHARRNEFTVDGRLLISYGGSESLQSPQANFSPTVNALLVELGVDVERFRRYFDQGLYPGLGLSRGSFFDRDRFGRDRLVAGDPTDWVADDIPPDRRNGRPIAEFIAEFPVPEAARRQLLDLYTTRRVTLGHLANEPAREAYLARVSYEDFLRRDWGLGDDAVAYFAGRTLDFFAAPPSLVPALDAAHFAYPGFAGIGLSSLAAAAAEVADPYIHHFPDGNASIARLLVRSLVPAAIPGSSMEDVVLARADYGELDRSGHPVRIRLDSTVVRVTDGGSSVEVTYADHRDRSLHRLRARRVVMACFNSPIPHMLDGVPADQAAALRLNVKAPLVYTKVVVCNWRPWVELGVHEIYGVASHHSRVKLDYPVAMGGYRNPTQPDEPMVLHLVHVPTAPGVDDPRAALREARSQLLRRSYADYEAAARRDLTRMLGPGGFDADRDIRAVTVNRWSHGYSWGLNTLVDDPDVAEAAILRARRPVGRVSIANSDSRWSAYAHSAIDAAAAAVDSASSGARVPAAHAQP